MTRMSEAARRTDVRVIAAGIGFTEGPVWMGDALAVTSITRGEIYRVPLTGAPAEVIARPGGGPNGLAWDPASGELWVAQNGRVHMPARASVVDRVAGLQRIRAGRVDQPLTVSTGAPNDIAVGPDGRLWFTEPAGDPHGPLQKTGRVWAWSAETGERELKWETDGYPNGLAFDVDGSSLYVAETRYARVRRFVVGPDGALTPDRTLELERGYPDGIAISVDGAVLVAGTTSGTVEVFDSRGEFAERFEFGEDSMPTNVCFAGARLDETVVTLAKGGRVVSIDAGRAGLPLAFSIASRGRTNR